MRALFTAVLMALPLTFTSMAFAAESPAGRWQTIDDETGKPKSIVEIQEAADGTLTGKVAQILQSDHGPNPVCSACEGERKDQPITGMTILWGLKPDGERVWTGGTILDPAKGKTYRAKVTLLEGGEKLEMRGYIGIEALGRTQTRSQALPGSAPASGSRTGDAARPARGRAEHAAVQITRPGKGAERWLEADAR